MGSKSCSSNLCRLPKAECLLELFYWSLDMSTAADSSYQCSQLHAGDHLEKRSFAITSRFYC